MPKSNASYLLDAGYNYGNGKAQPTEYYDLRGNNQGLSPCSVYLI
ncbi:hypothetical protein SLEP1_g57385 [Rubroshorea leprosula]|uniref:Uncharacterized protein n=1 Tax=Rubroshorea leprosula TaxID=152421 RepID=A0AAV5MMH1_9ROSI|nr:hypothetical protein SLEP1_g57385 [Rubroshorea leprosula]